MTKFVNAITQKLSGFASPDFGVVLGSDWTENDDIWSTDRKMLLIFQFFFLKSGFKLEILT